MSSQSIHGDIRLLAEKQHGVVGRGQARALGATRELLRAAANRGDWEPITTEVLRRAGSARTRQQCLMAAALDAGPGGVLSYQAAAELWGLPGFQGGVPVVSRPRGGTRRGSALSTIREPRELPAHHVTELIGIPVTTVARTVFDLAGTLHAGRVERALDNAIARRLVIPTALHQVVAELAEHGRGGSALMRTLMAERDATYVAPDSGLEARYLSIIQTAGLPSPVRQRAVGDREWAGRVDFLFERVGLVIEVDSHLHHWSKLDRAADRARDARLRAAGYTVLHIDEDLVWNRPAEAVTLTKAAIRQCSAA